MSLTTRITTLLRASEKYTKTDMVYLVSRSGLTVLAQLITASATLVFAIVVGHVLPKETYGEYKYVLSLIGILSLFSLNSIGSAVLQSTAQGYTGALRKGFWLNIRWSFVVFAGALVGALYYFILGNTTLAAELLIGGSLSPFLASANLYGSYLAGKKDFIRQMLYSIADNVATTAVMILTVLSTQSPLILVAMYFVANLLGALFFYARTRALYEAPRAAHDESMLSYSKHLSVIGILGGIADAIDKVLIFHYIGAAELAIYSFATALPNQFRTPIKTLDTMIQTGFVGRSSADIRQSITNKFMWYGIASVVVTTLFILCAPFLFHIFFPAYRESIPYAQVYMLGFLAITFDPAGSYLASRKKVREFYINGVFFSICQILTMLVGVWYWGVLGLVCAAVITRLLNALLVYFLYRRAIAFDIAHA